PSGHSDSDGRRPCRDRDPPASTSAPPANDNARLAQSVKQALSPGLSAGEFLAGTERAIDQELNRWRQVGPVIPEAVVS
ncbi:hypothetical protein FF100_36055, partial [Methylobacterium terricola]